MTASDRRRGMAAALAAAMAVTIWVAGCSSARDSGSTSGPGSVPASASTSSRSVTTAAQPPAGSSTSTTSRARASTSTTRSTVAPAGQLAGRVIVVDPGHNGANGAHPAEIARLVDGGGFQKACNTTGTAEGDLTESRFNWETAQRLRDDLEAAGATVVLTRTSDDGWGPCVDQRALTAQREHADLLVSIHADGADPSASGFHVIHPAAGPAVSPGNQEGSTRLATAVRDALVAEGLRPATYVGGQDGLVERTDIATVNRAGVPAVMLESGNLHNPSDLALLRSGEGQQRIADALTAAVVAYLANG